MPPLRTRLPVFLWNVFLAIFSILGVYHVTLPISKEIREVGLQNYICQADIPETVRWEIKTNAFAFYMFVFVLSKGAELIDTVLLILKQRKLDFLHTWHHFSVLIYCTHAGAWTHHLGSGTIFGAMNLLVHAIMYTYYALRTYRIPVPFPWLITLLQIAQMFAGCYVSYSVGGCENYVFRDRLLAGLIYTTYNVLFVHFFYNRFIWPKLNPEKAKALRDATTKSVEEKKKN